MTDTIYALASGAGRAGVAVLRLSGPASAATLQALAGDAPPPRRASLRRLTRPADGAALDEALVLWLPGPASFTGEDMAELHLHGGPAIIATVSAALSQLGLRPAEPGEFSRRAFAHGKLDLTQAEAIADLVDAETEAQRTQALRQLSGGLSTLYEGWRTRLIAAMALIEAEIDFPDEGDVQDTAQGAGLASRAGPALAGLAGDIRAHLDDAHRGERIRDGFHVAIIGAPNAGKSTLLNALAGRDAAIVTDIPGTTRDIVEVRLVLDGFLVVLADTAGLRDTDDPVEREGVSRARRRAEEADLRVLVLDAAQSEEAARASLAAFGEALRLGDVVALNKMDATDSGARSSLLGLVEAAGGHAGGVTALPLSARDGVGVPDLLAHLTAQVRTRLGASEAPSLTRARHRHALEEAAEALDAALSQAALAPELAGERARQAALAIGRITGRVDVEDILDRVFADFCIGK